MHCLGRGVVWENSINSRAVEVIRIAISIVQSLVISFLHDSQVAFLKYRGNGIAITRFLQEIQCFRMRCFLENRLASMDKPLAVEHSENAAFLRFLKEISNLTKPVVMVE